MIKQLLLSISLVAITLTLQAQDIQLYAGNKPGKNAVELKWLGKKLDRDASYDVYRKQGSGNWQKLNSQPIKRTTPLDAKQMEEEAKKPNHDDVLLIYSNAFMKNDDGDEDPAMKYFILYMLAPTQNRLAELMGLYYEDATAVAGTSYDYCITLAGGNISKPLAATSITAGAYTQPNAPTGFDAKGKDKMVDFKWTPDKKYAQYRIFRSSLAKGRNEDTLSILLSDDQLKAAAKGEFIATDKDSLLQNDKTYYYKICGVDYFGNETKLSAEIAATPVDMRPPNTVFALKTVLVDKGIKIVWQPSKESDVVGYNVLKSNNAKSGFSKLNSAMLAKADSVYIDKNVKETERYFYYVEVIDKKGNIGKSEVISFVIPDMTPPSTPKNLTAIADTGKITLKWDKNPESDIDGYYIFRALKNESSNFQLLNANPVKNNSFLDTLPKESGNRFLYRICAVDKNYNRSGNTAIIAVRMPDIMAPEAVVLKSADWDNGKVKLEWTPNFALDFKTYEVYRAEADTGFNARNAQKINTAVLGKKTTTYTDDKVDADKRWIYYVVCADSSGNRSEKSNTLSVVPGLVGEIKGSITLKAVYSSSAKTISLSWNSVSGASNYQIWRSTDGGSFLPSSHINTTTTFTDNAIEAGKNYVYKVMAISAVNDLYSNEAKVTTK